MHDAFGSATGLLTAWLGALPLDGADTEGCRELEAQIAEQLEDLDAGSDMDRRHAGLIRTLMERVNQRRASRRGEN